MDSICLPRASCEESGEIVQYALIPNADKRSLSISPSADEGVGHIDGGADFTILHIERSLQPVKFLPETNCIIYSGHQLRLPSAISICLDMDNFNIYEFLSEQSL